ncbi:beta-glucosidase [Hydrocarboniphaga sp.]|uniref:beta-glucosidase n=1 Tax=Hydrocarboniphaga sp. TaxID=2033016 RepID=UPI00345170F6
MHTPRVFDSFFLGGFECSTHRRKDGRRLDLLAATRHDQLAAEDYQAMREHGIRTLRDGLRWHLIETAPGRYDWSSFLPMLHAARAQGVQVIWDLLHYGWPDDLDIWSGAFVERFAAFAGAAARLVRDEGGAAPFYCPVNEISYWAWAGGETGMFWPLAKKRGDELKQQLARTAIAAVAAIRVADPRARIVFADPVINVVAQTPASAEDAERMRLAQYAAWDMLTGRQAPELGGTADTLDLIGVNYYSDNQWLTNGTTIARADRAYRPFSELLRETYARYGKPLFVAETGAEGEARSEWLAYIAGEVVRALGDGVPLEGICLYPVLDYPGWINDRHCETGLLGFADENNNGQREVHRELARQLAFQQSRIDALRTTGHSPMPAPLA